MFWSLVVGMCLTALSVVIHASGSTLMINGLQRMHHEDSTTKRGTLSQLRILCTSALCLVIVHVLEVGLWAIAYLFLEIDGISNAEEAVYFSTVSFTSLGYGDLVITNSWRLLGGIQAMSGLLMFGWSTALFFAVVQRVWLAPRLSET